MGYVDVSINPAKLMAALFRDSVLRAAWLGSEEQKDQSSVPSIHVRPLRTEVTPSPGDLTPS